LKKKTDKDEKYFYELKKLN